MKDWTKMTAGDWYTAGTQLDMLAGIQGDGCGTLDLLDAAAEAAPVVEIAERVDGALFGLALSDEPASDGGMFTVVAA
ncbi:hypothetical protein E1287_37670 [Actinomadura sp. KC06]|uniref:hypothetical protein n=1 Tax=Actinomadura sp. KC06 TaxID=2530369 RepID=UPI00104919C8|nr:hypothetical protein [Actinomadura sp. KC06]TDD24993.1 hypothetical protein E1287_37670 [Actinomadura sp. KC06]